jgi:hypothetical protein
LRNIAKKIQRLSSKSKKFLSVLFKVFILVLAAVFIYFKLNNNENLENFKKLIERLSPLRIGLTLGSVFLLMLVNWFLEALKWQFIIRQIQRINLRRAIESVLCGLTLAVFTPNRIGEYGGRVFFLSPKRRILGIVAMGVGAVGQMVVTNVLGALAIVWFAYSFLKPDNLTSGGILAAATVFCSFFILFYFNIGWMINLLARISFLKRFQKFFRVFSRYKKSDLARIFYYCLGRFCVFTSQYCLVINMLVPDMPVFSMAMMVFILFFIQSALPSLDLLDIGIRTLTASYFFGFITNQDIAIIASTAFIWLVNLIIPAILGAPFVFKLNFFGNRN